MRYVFLRNRIVLPGLMLLIGLVLGGMFPHTPLHAVATDRTESFLVASGLVDSDVEAVFLLDCLTGDLRAAVLGKTSGGFTSIYSYPGAQLMRDFGLDPSKNPKFHMVTGLADLRTGSQNVYGSAVLYVVEVSSGKIAAYAVPWNRARFLTRAPISANLVLVGMLPFRNPPPSGPAPKIGGAKAAKEKEKEKEN
jgi:hypothetical protein